jgi:hypothetical protein
VVGNAHIVPDALVDLAGPHVQVAERVGAVPVAGLRLDNPDVFGNGRVDAALRSAFSALLSAPSRSNGGTVVALSPSYQTASAA